MNRWIHVFLVFSIGAFFSLHLDNAKAQYLTRDPETGERLSLWQTDSYGPFGRGSIGKGLNPTYPNSRFSGSGARFGRAGQFLGVDMNSPNSKFKPYWENEPFNIEDYFPKASASNSNRSIANTTRMYNQPAPVEMARRTEPLRRPGQPMLGTDPYIPDEQLQRDPDRTVRVGSGEQWFRDRVPAGESGRGAGVDPVQGPIGPARAIGGDNFRPPIPSVQQTQPEPERQKQMQRVQEANRIRTIEEQMEEALIRSPNVHPLSPVKVTLSGGVARIEGVVPTKASKTEAGVILLMNPAVQSVDNRLSVLGVDGE